MTDQTTQPTGMLTLGKIDDLANSILTDDPVLWWRKFADGIQQLVSQAYEARIARLEEELATALTDKFDLHTEALQSPTNIPDHIHLHAGEEVQPNRCKGIPRKGCNYLAACDSFCNKCGEVHKHHQMVAMASPQQPPTTAPANMSYERSYAIKEGARNSAEEEYFKARPQLDFIGNRRIFESGFDRGYDAALASNAAPVQPSNVEVLNSMLADASRIDGAMKSHVQNNEEALRKALMNLYQEIIATNETYERLGGNGDPLFEEELIAIEKAISQPANEVTEYWCGTCERNIDRGCGDSACQARYKLPAKPANEVKVDECLTCASGITKPEPSDPYDDRSGHYHSQVPSDKQAVQAVPSWQPIETAPKDGTRLFLYWASQNSDGSFMRHERVIGRFMQDGLWHIEDAMFANVVRHEKLPEYWMPLPAAPQPDQKG